MVKSGTATSKRAGKIAVREAGEDKEDDKTSEVETESPAPEEANEVVGLPENIEPKESEEVLMNSDAKEDGNEDVGTLKEADNDSVEEKDKEEVRDGKVVQEHQMDTTPGPVIEAEKVTVTWKSENAMETMTENSEVDHVDEQNGNVTPGKRKAESTVETSPSKKMMFINDDFCLFVGNLNKSKKLEEIKDSLANFFKTHSLFIQDIRLDRSRRFGYIDFSTEEDLKKALELNGEKVLDNQLKLDKAKVKEIVANDKNAKDARTLFVKNLPLSATKEDLKNVFDKAVDFRFPVGFDCSSKGFAYVEFKTEAIAEKELEEKQGTDVKGRVIIIDFMGKKSNQNAPDDITPSNTLIVCNLAYTTKEYALKKVFVKAVSIRIPQRNGKIRGYAFIVFGSVDDAKDAMELSQNKKICGRAIRIEYSKFEQRPQHDKASSVISKTLFVRGLAEETSDETLKSAFEGAIAACVNTDKDTCVSRGFGFINFESQEDCKAAKEAMEDCEIDGSKVSLAYAISNGERGLRGDRGGFRGRPGSYGRGGGGKGFRGRGGNRGGRGGGFGKKSQDGKDGRKTVTS